MISVRMPPVDDQKRLSKYLQKLCKNAQPFNKYKWYRLKYIIGNGKHLIWVGKFGVEKADFLYVEKTWTSTYNIQGGLFDQESCQLVRFDDDLHAALIREKIIDG